MIFFDFEVFRHDWLVVWCDTKTHKFHHIVNDKVKLEKFYEYYKNDLFVGYNSRNYDTWILKAILCDFNPYDMSQWIIEKDRKGHEFSKLLQKFPMYNYDCAVFGKSLKELEAYMGHDIRETSVPFNIDRKLTPKELEEVVQYCMHDVRETMAVFLETLDDYNTHIGLIEEFKLPYYMVNKTGTQLSAEVLGAVATNYNDEFEINMPNNIILGRYQHIKDHFMHWAKYVRDYEQITLNTTIANVPHTLGVGGIHGALLQYQGDGFYMMADVDSYYPAGMINNKFLSRSVRNPEKYRKIRDERVIMKRNKDKREKPRKLVLNKVFGGSKDKYNKLYDPLQANNLCISNQLYLIDLIDKLEDHCQLIQSNTDGILVKLYREEDKEFIHGICEEWCKRTGFTLSYDYYNKVFQKDVNNYIIMPHGEQYDKNGNELFKRKGSWAKKLKLIDNDLPIVNKALVDYFVSGVKPEVTICNATKLIDFQKVVKVTGKYEFGFKVDTYKSVGYANGDIEYRGEICNEKVYRVFATKESHHGELLKKHKKKNTLDKVANTPEHCVIINENIENTPVPEWLDKSYYVELVKERISKFVK